MSASDTENVADIDRWVGAAAERVAAGLIYSGPSTLESALVNAFQRQLAAPFTVHTSEPHYVLPGWSRSPGGVDLAADLREAEGRVLMEMKVGKPDEGLWDAIKLADITAMSPVPPIVAAYLVYDGDARSWRSETPGAGIFLETARDRPVQEMIRRWPDAWLNLLIGGRGIRPRRCVESLRTEPLGKWASALHGGQSLRIVRVRPGPGEQTFDEDGWPVGYEPPEPMRALGREADAVLAGASPAISVETDPCHGYPWHRSWTQSRLATVVPTLDAEAYACLRSRLAAERSWSEEELQKRVDPLASPR